MADSTYDQTLREMSSLLTSFQKELMLSPALSALLDNEVKVLPHLLSNVYQSTLTNYDSCHALRLSSAYGPMFARTTYKIRTINA